MNRRNYYFRKKVDTETMFDLQDNVENADKNIVKSLFGVGISNGLSVSSTANAITIGSGTAHDSNGNTLDIPVVTEKSLTPLIPATDKRWVSYSARFKRVEADFQTDGYGATVFFQENEGYEIIEFVGNISSSPEKPMLTSNDVIIVDILLNTTGIELVDLSRVKKLDGEVKLIDLLKTAKEYANTNKLDKSQNLNDLTDKATARNNIEVFSKVETYQRLAPSQEMIGLTLSNNTIDPTNDIDISIGNCFSDELLISPETSRNMKLTSGLTKRLDAVFAEGTNQGMLDTGVVGDGTYHIFLIMKADFTTDILASTSATSPTMPSGFVYKRRIGSILVELSAIVPFLQNNSYFLRNNSLIVTGLTTTFIAYTVPLPAGISLTPILTSTMKGTGTEYVIGVRQVGTLIETGIQYLTGAEKAGVYCIVPFLKTNTSRQIEIKILAGTSESNVWCSGWIDERRL